MKHEVETALSVDMVTGPLSVPAVGLGAAGEMAEGADDLLSATRAIPFPALE
jgi:hypothetical protein